jgi:hypothetical protein
MLTRRSCAQSSTAITVKFVSGCPAPRKNACLSQRSIRARRARLATPKRASHRKWLPRQKWGRPRRWSRLRANPGQAATLAARVLRGLATRQRWLLGRLVLLWWPEPRHDDRVANSPLGQARDHSFQPLARSDEYNRPGAGREQGGCEQGASRVGWEQDASRARAGREQVGREQSASWLWYVLPVAVATGATDQPSSALLARLSATKRLACELRYSLGASFTRAWALGPAGC